MRMHAEGTRPATGSIGRAARAVGGFLVGPTFAGGLALAALVVLFLWTPITRYHEVYYSSADLLQDFSLTRVQPGFPAVNKLMSDGVTEMRPWAMFDRDELTHGRIPWWNPWNGTGCPHFANYQSAVFSPFTLPWYVLGTKAALLVETFLKLWLCGFFTFLFLKKLGLRFLPALLGGTAFLFGGHNVLLVTFPHVGAQVVLPAGCYFAECVLQRFERWARSFRTERPRAGSGGPFVPEPGVATGPEPEETLALRTSEELSAQHAVESTLARHSATQARAARERWTGLRGPLAGLALTFAFGLLAGQPEVFYFSFLLVAAYIAARLVGLLRDTRGVAGAVQRLLGVSWRFALAGLLGAGLAAFQLLPFFEFLRNSRLYEQRSVPHASDTLVQTPLSTEYWPLMLFPNAIGNPSSAYNLSFEVPRPNYELVNMAYAGGLVVFLAVLALAFVRRSRHVAFFALAATAWLFYAYDLFGAAQWFSKLPTVSIAPMNRSQGVWLFCVAVLAAFAVDRLLRGGHSRRFLMTLATVAGALAFLFTCLAGVDRLIEEYATIDSPNHGKFAPFVPEHVLWMSQLFAAGVCATLVLWLVRARFVQVVCGLVLLASVFLQTGWLLHDYNPCTADELFYPVTPALRELMARVGDERLAILGEDKLPPDVNLVYRLQTIDNYDGMWVQKYDRLYRDQFGDTNNWRPILKANEHALKVFGVQWVLAKWGWNFVGSGFDPLNRAGGQKFLRHEIVPGGTITQTIKPHQDRLQAVAVYLSTYNRVSTSRLEFELAEADTGRVLVQQTMRVAEVQSTVYSSAHARTPYDFRVDVPGRNVVFRFDPIEDSKNKVYRVTLSSTDAQPGTCAYAWSAPLLAYGEGQATWKGKALKGEILFDFSCCLDHFEETARIGDYVLYRYKDALPSCTVVRGSVIAESDEEALALLRLSSFDPAQIVVLSDDASLSTETRAGIGPVDNSERRLVKFTGDDKVYLVEERAHRLVHIQNEVVFLINKLRWDRIETVPPSEFEGWPRTFEDVQAQIEAGLRVVVPDVKGQRPLQIVERTPTRIAMELDRLWPTWIVIAQAWFPGWKAYVDGVEVPVWRANYAFDAISAPAGRHAIELVYEPDSLRVGAWISACSLALGLASLRRRGGVFAPAA